MTEIQTSIRFKSMSTSLTWLTFCIAQHFVVPLFLGILQPGKDAYPPSVSDFLTLKPIQVSSQHTLTLYGEADVTNSCSQSSNISIPSPPFVEQSRFTSACCQCDHPPFCVDSFKHDYSSFWNRFKSTSVLIWSPLNVPQSLPQRETE